jgi:hypothetical protein
MGRVTSYWYREGDGEDLHRKDKNLLIYVLHRETGGMGEDCPPVSFNDLAKLIIKREWLVPNEKLLPSMVLMGKIREERLKYISDIL